MCHGGLGAEHDGVAERVEAADQALDRAMLVDAVEVVGAEGLLAGSVQRLGSYAPSANGGCGWERAGSNRWPKPGPSAPL